MSFCKIPSQRLMGWQVCSIAQLWLNRSLCSCKTHPATTAFLLLYFLCTKTQTVALTLFPVFHLLLEGYISFDLSILYYSCLCHTEKWFHYVHVPAWNQKHCMSTIKNLVLHLMKSGSGTNLSGLALWRQQAFSIIFIAFGKGNSVIVQ